ncbi:MAG TPA: 2-succinyl-5-enolpyruvyl-6-hydroxy-3-cyclohexene-1-carboxylic-acid synthase, partial [Prolixibacteraceae bacterium]|nr:2-succinyl-5-enolpyruvyl-6-hydroxy-3-cyclohexene-1-carboxylic-acid synthase [Prolixibacteraceae bacterium]
ISPGSRNAPLTRLFSANPAFTCHSIVDERSAAFYALGISLASKKPVALVCTSGTAVLNYAPALAEAFYQRVPLIAITADRPAHLIDQQDNQTIHQVDVYHNFIKGSINLAWPLQSEKDLAQQHVEISNIINLAVSGIQGPVQINAPISEPLYEALPQPSPFLKITKNENLPSNNIESSFLETWKNAKRRMVLCGQNTPNEELQKTINLLSKENQAIVLAEPISNMKGENVISPLDRVLMRVEQSELEEFQPDLLVSFGGPVVSKRLKQWLQKQTNLVHWRIAEQEDEIDTYQNRKAHIVGKPAIILAEFAQIGKPSESQFLENWQQTMRQSFAADTTFFRAAPFCDASVFHFILNDIPTKATLHLGNSSPVRYAQMYTCQEAKAVYSNRGVSGIDGSLSTASGIATISEGLHVVLLGDLSFVYDSNALWNRNFPENLRIVVINNGGGGIFRLLPGPSEQECFEDFMEASHPVQIEKLAQAFGVNYFRAENQQELELQYSTFIEQKGPSLFEIKTPNTENPVQFKAHIQKIKEYI